MIVQSETQIMLHMVITMVIGPPGVSVASKEDCEKVRIPLALWIVFVRARVIVVLPRTRLHLEL